MNPHHGDWTAVLGACTSHASSELERARAGREDYGEAPGVCRPLPSTIGDSYDWVDLDDGQQPCQRWRFSPGKTSAFAPDPGPLRQASLISPHPVVADESLTITIRRGGRVSTLESTMMTPFWIRSRAGAAVRVPHRGPDADVVTGDRRPDAVVRRFAMCAGRRRHHRQPRHDHGIQAGIDRDVPTTGSASLSTDLTVTRVR